MKKLYLLLLMLLILFIPTSINAVAIYQLDQPINELNGHTLREVFDEGNMIINGDFEIDTIGYGLANYWEVGPNVMNNHRIIDNMQYWTGTTTTSSSRLQQIFTPPLINTSIYVNVITNNVKSMRMYWGDQYLLQNIQDGKNSNITVLSSSDFQGIYFEPRTANVESGVKNVYFINLSSFGISSLTVEQMDMYYYLYLEAVRFEEENIQASQDIGDYQNIFRSIINGVKNLISEMGYLWQWLNAPILTSEFQDYQFNIDWSWDLIGVIRQIINSAGVLVMQILFFVPSAMFILTGIPIKVSILSLLFSNFIFLVLGWIIVKSFLI